MALLGLGMDVCSVERMRKILEGPRAARFLERVYTPAERAVCDARADAASAYAARFAAKEALVKALGAPPGLRWQDIEVARVSGAPPTFTLSGVAAASVSRLKARAWLALTHDGGVAAATVVLEHAT
ncbi:MAG: holo-ACP synthase [Myxococcaceae bacterium]